MLRLPGAIRREPRARPRLQPAAAAVFDSLASPRCCFPCKAQSASPTPGGFEGLATIHVLLHLCEAAVLNPDRHEHRDSCLDAASLRSDCAVDGSVDEVALAFPEFPDRGPIGISNLEEVIPYRKHLLNALKCAEAASFPDDPRVKKAQRFLALGREVIRLIRRSDRAWVSPIRGHRAIGRVKEPANDLDVLLRHPPRSIPGRSVAFHAKQDFSLGHPPRPLPRKAEWAAEALAAQIR